MNVYIKINKIEIHMCEISHKYFFEDLEFKLNCFKKSFSLYIILLLHIV